MSSLADRLVAGDRRALARALTLVEDRSEEGAAALRAVFPRTGCALVVGITGPPGVGKSTLIDALLTTLRSAGRTVAVVAVDPSSSHGGALLGDRVRLGRHSLDPGIFVRSVATRGAGGGLASTTLQSCLLMDAAGFEVVLVETVGVGQVEVDVAELADVVVLCLMPGAGDPVQALKSGIMEIPDVIAVCRGEDPAAVTTEREVRDALSLREGAPRTPLLRVDAKRGLGIEDLWTAIEGEHARIRGVDGGGRRCRALRQEVVRLVLEELRRRTTARLEADRELDRLVALVAERRLDPLEAAARALEHLDTAGSPSPSAPRTTEEQHR